ncbi:Uncharacterized conserved protein YloU, alkaline shock protein (Asp23) family [Ruminococcus sp. YE71]|uniref:Asp23/Gls24 family envelope stress response protein n=1 Tax=unclassified Ruminococcus TaxID=2608920 RepID=UPI00088BE7BE|nr:MULTISPECIES: Asp23/Gls24 family envelope stress response protein [unclassified Ruminococcus]SDA17044.1 Uncharacterized conserved protein YloU, alkaline shock protein (Asp23) family [Ruminococcus sp. YE78]SFW25981.1 Uncharacterized conserved protein YloU, alkaline shock protein (Asp23) family [Ruminococcus sp. YE71]
MDKDKISKSIDGSLYVSEDVIAKVIEKAVSGVDGVVGIASSAHNPLRLLFAKENHGKVKFRLDGDVLSVAVGIVLRQDASAKDTSEKVQESIKEQVQNVLGITVARVNVNVLDMAV